MGAPSTGLTSDEARRRLRDFGPNATPEEKVRPWRRLLAKFWAPVPWMLEAAIVLQLTLGERVEAAVIAVLVLFNAALGYVQEGRAQSTLQALKSRLALSASVRRDGVWSLLPAAQLVPGDLIKLSLGGIVPADARLLEGEVLLDQSMLTGESLPVEGGAGREAYAGALIRRGEATAEVTATGARTRFGRTAELVRTAHGTSSQQATVLRVVRNLAVFNGATVLAQVAYGAALGLPTHELIPLTLTAILAAIPVALPATFTLASALGARSLAARGVLPTRLSAVEEAATLDILCSDKTGTLTQNALEVTAVRPMPGYEEARVLALAALASSEGGQDPVDGAVRAAASKRAARAPTAADVLALTVSRFIPFDPASKMAEAISHSPDGREIRIVKGAFRTVSKLAAMPEGAAGAVQALAAQGFRIIAVAVSASAALSSEKPQAVPASLPPAAGAEAAHPLELVGLMALSDPPRADSAALIAELRALGVRTVMVTGDAPATAAVIARDVGLEGPVCPTGAPSASVHPEDFAVFAGVFPEDKFHIVKAFQQGGHTVGMCGDGANDAPALRQAQMGIAVSSATDVAKSAAGIVLTEPGLGGIVSAVREGRIVFQRILTYTLRSLTQKLSQMLLLVTGLVMTGHAILTPRLMAILMITGDFLAMSATTDNVRPSGRPNAWHVNNVTLLGVVLALCNVTFCTAMVAVGYFRLGLARPQLRTLAAVTLVFVGQATFYVVRDRRRLWSSRPSGWIVASSVADIAIIAVLATQGWLMAAVPATLVGLVLGASLVLTWLLDAVKAVLSRSLAVQ
ncbi:MAG TPA: HAD-IC family P-type ATPase [Steroidobacteraceae bacterium]|nr:HAD-IC family P-type ATPase [Steroidobacteraceae bacterium]